MIDLQKHAEAVIQAAFPSMNATIVAVASVQPAVLTALAALADEAAVAMREAAAKYCDEEGAYEQEGYGLNRAAQNYFRARNGIRALDPRELRSAV